MKRSIFLSLTLFFGFTLISCAQENKSNYYTNNGLVIDGYDVVSYFRNDQPVKGLKKYRASFEGQIFLFSNDENRELFKSVPEKYIPKYGGWCAYAMGIDGSKVKIDPETFKIIDGELYLFYNFNLTNTLNKWNQNELKLISQADSYWSQF